MHVIVIYTLTENNNQPLKHYCKMKNLRSLKKIQWLLNILGDSQILANVFNIPLSSQKYMPSGPICPTKCAMYYVNKETSQQDIFGEVFFNHWYALTERGWFDPLQFCQKTNGFCQLFSAFAFRGYNFVWSTSSSQSEATAKALHIFLTLLKPEHLDLINFIQRDEKRQEFVDMQEFKNNVVHIIENIDFVLENNY